MLLLLFLLPFPLTHQHGGQHCDHHRDCNDEHRDCFSNAQLRVHVHQPVVLQDGWCPAGQIEVVVQEEPLDAAELPEKSLKVAVTVPGVSVQQDVGAVGVNALEGFEGQSGELVVGEVEQSHADERLKNRHLHVTDVVSSQVKDFQRAQH